MGVIHYGPGDHPAGFIGFRVTRGFDDRFLQRYFSTATAEAQRDSDAYFQMQRLRAEVQDLEWTRNSLLFQYRRFVSQNHPHTKPFRGVGVHGITIGFQVLEHGDYQPGIYVSHGRGAETKGRKLFTLVEKPYSQAWSDAVEFWAKVNDIYETDKARVLANQPDPQQFVELRRHMAHEEGQDIQPSALHWVFEGDRQLKASNAPAKDAWPAEGDSKQNTVDRDALEQEIREWFEQEIKKAG